MESNDCKEYGRWNGSSKREEYRKHQKNPVYPDMPAKKAIVVRAYPRPSRWLVVKYESGDMDQVEESQVTAIFEENRKILL